MVTIRGDISQIPLRIQRKIVSGNIQRKNNISSFDIQSIGEGEYYGFHIGGDHLFLLGDFTVTHNTFCLQNIFATNPDLNKLLFEMELADSLTTERFISVATGTDGLRVQQEYRKGGSIDWRSSGKIKNVYVCPKSGISMKFIDEQLERAAAKIGNPVDAFAIDYIQLIRGEGKQSRYERVSDAAEEAKILAKKWSCVGILLSQVSRKEKSGKAAPEDQIREITLEDAKESGSIENSCGLVLGVWKTSRTELAMKILKNTKGLAGQRIAMEIGAGVQITEKRIGA